MNFREFFSFSRISKLGFYSVFQMISMTRTVNLEEKFVSAGHKLPQATSIPVRFLCIIAREKRGILDHNLHYYNS